MTEESEQAADAQQEAPQDSGLQTPQPDQRMPTEEERSASSTTSDPGEVKTEPGPDRPPNAPRDYESQVPLQSGQVGGIHERPGEQVSDVEESVDDQNESSADQNDDEAVDDSESGEPG